mmetsp:Transcript_32990/g.60434  ORF Transcript_32990/g.60434 Transcript_32990/m.60434 type:complete len:920 (+) Transcript_32990:77-2836(+)
MAHKDAEGAVLHALQQDGQRPIRGASRVVQTTAPGDLAIARVGQEPPLPGTIIDLTGDARQPSARAPAGSAVPSTSILQRPSSAPSRHVAQRTPQAKGRPSSASGIGPSTNTVPHTVQAKAAPQAAPQATAQAAPVQPRPPRLTCLVLAASALDCEGRSTDNRVAVLIKSLREHGIAARLQADISSAAPTDLPKACVLFLTRDFMDALDRGQFGDPCVAGFALAKRIPRTIIAAGEPGVVDPAHWGWNQVFARLCSKPIVDLSMEDHCTAWADQVANLAKLLDAALPMESLAMSDLTNPHKLTEPVKPQPLESSRPRDFDVFISHCWNSGSEGDEHRRKVLTAVQYLQRQGLRIFFPDWEMNRYRSYDEALIDGARRSAVAAMFLSRPFVEKVKAANPQDDCVAEFNLCTKLSTVITVIVDPELLASATWGSHGLLTHLSSDKLRIDLTSSPAGVVRALFSPSAQRWYAAMDQLVLRIHQDAAESTGLGHARLPPFVRQRDLMLLSSSGLVLACLTLCVASYLDCDSGAGEVALSAASVIFALSFMLLLGCHIQRARLPPTFVLQVLFLPRGAILACLVCVLGWILFAVQPLLLEFQDEAWNLIAGGVLAAGGVATMLDACLQACGGTWSMDDCGINCQNIPSLAGIAFGVGSILLLLSAQEAEGSDWQRTADERLPAAACTFRYSACGLLTLMAFMLFAWAFLGPAQLRRFFSHRPSGPNRQQGTVRENDTTMVTKLNNKMPASPPSQSEARSEGGLAKAGVPRRTKSDLKVSIVTPADAAKSGTDGKDVASVQRNSSDSVGTAVYTVQPSGSTYTVTVSRSNSTQLSPDAPPPATRPLPIEDAPPAPPGIPEPLLLSQAADGYIGMGPPASPYFQGQTVETVPIEALYAAFPPAQRKTESMVSETPMQAVVADEEAV